VVAEIYSSVSIGILFWQTANEVVPVDQAKRFYPLFGQVRERQASNAAKHRVAPA